MVEIYSKKKAKEKTKSSRITEPRKEVYKMIGRSNISLSSFVARPKKMGFENQFDGEEIILLLRRHWITNFQNFVIIIFMLIAPVFLGIVPILDFLPLRFQTIVIMMWYLFCFAFILESFLKWYFNVYIITDERIIDVDFYNLIYKEVSDAELDNIEDVTLKMGGVAQTLFNYGTVSIQTAAEVPQIDFEFIPKPNLVVKVLNRLMAEEKIEEMEGRIR